MLSLSVIAWITIFAAIAAFWWHSDGVKNKALKIAGNHCNNLGVQLLDQTMVIKGVWPVRDESDSVRLRRRYRFEFTSTGEHRYFGSITMIGNQLQDIEMDPHLLP